MPRNVSGTYALPPAYNPVVSGTIVLAAWANTTLNDVASEMTNSLDRTGKGGMLAALRGIDGTAAQPAYSFSGDANTGIYSPGVDQIAVATGGSERLRIDDSGNVGIGRTNPQNKQTIAGASAYLSLLNTDTGASSLTPAWNGIKFFADTETVGGSVASIEGGNYLTNNYGGFLRFSTATNGVLGAPVERMRIDSSGNVGVGTGSPVAKIDVRGEVLGGNGTIQAALSFSSRAEVGSKSNHSLGLITNNLTQAILDTSGNFTLVTGGGLGYGVGSGGTVTQATSKSTVVPLNKPCGRVTMNAAALSAGATVYFTLSNTSIAATDGLLLTLQSGFATTGTYEIKVDAIVANNAVIGLKNISAGSLSEAVAFNFQVVKGATS